MTQDYKQKEQSRSTLVMMSYGLGKFLAEFFIGAFGALVYYYYENNLGLSGGLVAAAIIIYSIWNAINDPLVGYFTAKPTRLSRKWGRRYPWILFSSLLWGVSFLLIFTIPDFMKQTEVTIFIWMVLFICLHDFLYSLWDVNYQSLFPDKFRSDKERGKAAGIGTLIGVFGIAAGALVPTFIVEYEIDQTFITNGLVFLVAGLVINLLFLPGVREDRIMIDRYFIDLQKEEKKPTFFAQLASVMKERNFVAFTLLYFFYQAAMMSLTASIYYVGDYVLGGQDTTLIFAGMLVGALISIPLWLIIRKKVGNNQKILVYCAIVLAIFTLPMTWINDLYGFVVAMLLWGLGFGGFWMMLGPALADVIDEIVVKRRKRDDGMFMGFRAFFGRLSYAMQALTFWIVHELTNFVNIPGYEQEELALLGIHLHTSTIPTVFLVIGVIVFLLMNTLTKEKVIKIKTELKELNL